MQEKVELQETEDDEQKKKRMLNSLGMRNMVKIRQLCLQNRQAGFTMAKCVIIKWQA